MSAKRYRNRGELQALLEYREALRLVSGGVVPEENLSCNAAQAESVDGNSDSLQAQARQSSPPGNEPALGERPSNPGRALEVAGQAL